MTKRKEVDPNRIEKHHITPRCLLKHKDKSFINRKYNMVRLPRREHDKAHQWLFMLLGDACGTGIPHAYYAMVLNKWYSDSRRGKPLTKKTKKKISEAHKGKKASEESRKKMSEAHKGTVYSQERRDKFREQCKNRVVSKKTKRKMSEAAKRTGSVNSKRCSVYGVIYRSVREATKHSGKSYLTVFKYIKDPNKPDFFYC